MKIRKALPLVLILLLAVILPVSVSAAVDLSDPQYVVDDAGVLSSELEQKILETNEKLWNDCSGAEFVVVTVSYPPAGLDQEEFAKKIFDSWHIGSASENNGLLLVVYTEADDFWLQPGEGVFNSPYVDEIADLVSDDSSFYRLIRSDRDEEAVSELLEGVFRWYRSHWRSSASTVHTAGAPSPEYDDQISDAQALFVLLALILFFYIITSPIRCYRRWGHFGIWPFFYLSPWWRTRTRVVRPVIYRAAPARPIRPSRPTSYSRPPSRPSSYSRPSSGSSFPGSGGRSGSGGFGGGRSSGGFSGRPGGGGRSGSGGFGHR